MKENIFKSKIQRGIMPIGHMLLEFVVRSVPQILDVSAIDFVIVDMEYSGFDSSDIATLMANFKSTLIAPFVRIPEAQYHFITRSLDAGALGIIAPKVNSAVEAKKIVSAVKYAPDGERGVLIGGALMDFRNPDPLEFMAYSNKNTSVICQIETINGLNEVEAIAATPGVDVLFVGAFDLCQSLGIPLKQPMSFDDDNFIKAVERIKKAAKENGKYTMSQPRTFEQAKFWIDMGFDSISFGADAWIYRDALISNVSKIRNYTENAQNKIIS